MVSQLDAELIASWAEENVPFEVVARGISRAAERSAWDQKPNTPVLRSLKACRREVDQEIKRFRHASVGKNAEENASPVSSRTAQALPHPQELCRQFRRCKW